MPVVCRIPERESTQEHIMKVESVFLGVMSQPTQALSLKALPLLAGYGQPAVQVHQRGQEGGGGLADFFLNLRNELSL